MGRKTPVNSDPDYSEVIRVIEHHLQHGSSFHPYDSRKEAAIGMADKDAWRVLVEIGEALDRAERLC